MVKYTIMEKYGVLTPGGTDNWHKEFNFVKWGNNTPKYDIRKWKDNNAICGKGITIANKEELKKCAVIIKNNLNKINGPFPDATSVGKQDGKLTCTLCLELGKIAPTYNNMTLEVNIVQWGNNSPGFDIRPWSDDKSISGKGVTLNKNEAENFLALYRKIDPNFEKPTDIKIKAPGGVIDEIII